MQAIALFGLTLVLMGIAFAVPTSYVRNRAIRDQDAPVLGAAVLEIGMGTMNFAALVWFAFAGEISGEDVGYGALSVSRGVFATGLGIFPLMAAALGLRAVVRKVNGMSRLGHLLPAAAFTLLGFPVYFAPPVAALATAITAFLYLSGLVRDPRTLLKSLDPRN